MDVNIDKVICLLERVTSGNAGAIDLEYYHHSKTCNITWGHPKGVLSHVSWETRLNMLLYVRGLLADMGVVVILKIDATEEDFLPED